MASAAIACVKPGVAPPPHPEPLNCGQLLLNSLEFAREVWASRPKVFRNGAVSQQGYANQIRRNYSESGLPLAFFNHCWKAHRYTRIADACGLQTYHATCEMVAKSKRAAMNAAVVGVEQLGCSRSGGGGEGSAGGGLSRAQLRAFRKRAAQPGRLTMQ